MRASTADPARFDRGEKRDGYQPREDVDRRIRLLKFVTLFGCGGTERQFVNLGRALDTARFDLRYGCLSSQGDLLESVRAQGIEPVEYPIPSFYSREFVRQAWRFARDVRRARIDIVHAYSFYGNVFAIPAARLAGVPIVIASVRDQGVYLTPTQARVHRFACRLADCVLVNADAIKQGLVAQGVDPARIVVIHNGIDLEPFEQTESTAAIRQELGVPVGVPVVGVAGRLSRAKGLEDFVDAAALIHQAAPEARFLVVGGERVGVDPVPGHAYRDRLIERALRAGVHDRFIFTGYRADIPRLLRAMDVSVLPSHSEGLPNAVLEAMAAGVAVVATRVGGVPEVVVDQETGRLVAPGDPPALAAAVLMLLSDPAATAAMGRAGRARVRDHFSVASMAERTQRLYLDSVLGAPGTPATGAVGLAGGGPRAGQGEYRRR